MRASSPPTAGCFISDPTVLRWKGSPFGCIGSLTAASVLFFAVAAVRPAMVEDMANGRHGGWFELSQQTVWYGINWGMVFVALFLLSLFGRMGWRWADRIAARIEGDTLRFHPTVWRDPIPLPEIADAEVRASRWNVLVRVRLVSGRWIDVRWIDVDSANAFAERLRLDRAARTATPVVR